MAAHLWRLTNNKFILTISHFGDIFALKLLKQILFANVVFRIAGLFLFGKSTTGTIGAIIEHHRWIHIKVGVLFVQNIIIVLLMVLVVMVEVVMLLA